MWIVLGALGFILFFGSVSIGTVEEENGKGKMRYIACHVVWGIGNE